MTRSTTRGAELSQLVNALAEPLSQVADALGQ